jgi:predicted Zn-dependent peptidase
MAYRERVFVPSNIVISATGVPHEALAALAEGVFEGASVGEPVAAPTATYEGGYMKVRKDVGGSATVGLGFPLPSGDAGTFASLYTTFNAKNNT